MSPPPSSGADSPTQTAYPQYGGGPDHGAGVVGGGGGAVGVGGGGHGHGHSPSSSLTFPRSASVLGYCLLPLVMVGLVGVVMPLDSMVGYVLSVVAIGWCTYSSSKMFCAVGRMRSMRGLVAYPLALFYCGFGIMGIFSSTGSLTKVG